MWLLAVSRIRIVSKIFLDPKKKMAVFKPSKRNQRFKNKQKYR